MSCVGEGCPRAKTFDGRAWGHDVLGGAVVEDEHPMNECAFVRFDVPRTSPQGRERPDLSFGANVSPPTPKQTREPVEDHHQREETVGDGQDR